MTPFQKSALTIAVDWLAKEPTDLSSWAAQGRRVRVMLEAALKEPKPEPVAFMHRCWSPDCGEFVDFHTVEEMKFIDRTEWTPLYAAPPEPGPTGKDSLQVDAARELIDAKTCRYPACQDADGRCPRIFAGQCSGPGGVVA
jgi:hypothetical protein